MWLHFVVDPEISWPDEYKGARDTYERLRVSPQNVRDGTSRRIPARKPADGKRPEYELYSFSTAKEGTRALRRLFARNCDVALRGSYSHELRHRDPSRRHFVRSLFVREGAVVQVREFETGIIKFAAVLHFRRWLLLLPLLLAALLLCLSLSLCGSGSSPVAFLQGQTSISGATSKPVLTTSYVSYSATPDTVWRAGQTRQDMTLLLPATCTVDGKEGSNPILSAPAIAVDLNNNGSFESSEVIFNSEGAYLRAGAELRHIELSKKLDSGEYAARTIWTSVLAEDGKTPAGTATFDWHLTVK